MYEKTKGYKYEEQANKTTAEISKLIRADVKQAVEEGLLPARWTYSVKSDNYSGGRSIDVSVRNCADAWVRCDGNNCVNVWCKARNVVGYEAGAEYHDRLTEEAQAAKMTLKRIHGAYNHDASDIQSDYFDVNYYGQVTFEDARTAQWRAEEAARLASRKAARESGTLVGKVRNYKRDGSRVVHWKVLTPEGAEKLACGAPVYRGSLIGTANDDDTVTCSRCVKFAARKTESEA
ncbi:MAG: hypothetical protein KGL39_04090 [Patescibacteria group bacterium]|nr:hypothetical protein [Patescibacteria group bacterium]